MGSPDLVTLTAAAFSAVFVLLAALSLIMVVITRIFPARQAIIDAARVAAITTVARVAIPGARVVEIEEVR